MAHVGEQIKVLMQTADGIVHDISGYVSEFSITQNIDGMTYVDTRIVGSGGYNRFLSDEWESEVSEKKSKKEWECDWCHSPNVWRDRHCTQCGGIRSFIYG